MRASRGRMRNTAAAVVVAVGLCCVAGGGCASRGRAAIASGARTVKSGVGTVEYTATRDGSVYVLESSSNRLVALGGVRAGQIVRADAETDQVTIGGKVINNRPISAKGRYDILFRADAERNDR